MPTATLTSTQHAAIERARAAIDATAILTAARDDAVREAFATGLNPRRIEAELGPDPHQPGPRLSASQIRRVAERVES